MRKTNINVAGFESFFPARCEEELLRLGIIMYLAGSTTLVKRFLSDLLNLVQ